VRLAPLGEPSSLWDASRREFPGIGEGQRGDSFFD